MSLFTPKLGIDNFYDRAKFLLAWRISLCFALIFSTLLIIYGFSNSAQVFVVSSVICLTLFCLIFLKVTENYKPIFWIYTIGGTVLCHYAINTVMDFTHYVDFLWMISAVLLAFVGLNKRAGVFFLIINTLAVGYFFAFTLNKHITTLQPKSNIELIGDFVEVCLAMFCISYLLFQYFKFHDYTSEELQDTNYELEKQNNENVMLLKEVHHRVKNNLQIITSLLRTQKEELKDSTEEKKFDEAINRIMTLSLIHQKLYQENSLSKVNLPTYIKELTEEIAHSYHEVGVDFNISCSVDIIDMKAIVPFGLLLNELVTNSFKHAFKNNQGRIDIEIKESDEQYIEMIYKDYGIWNDSPKLDSKFGLELIETLTEQMDGKAQRKDSEYIFHLKVKE